MQCTSGSFSLTWDTPAALARQSVGCIYTEPEFLQKKFYSSCEKEGSIRDMSFGSIYPRPKHTPVRSGLIRDSETR